MNDHAELERIASALERIAKSLEAGVITKTQSKVFTLDGRTIAQQIMRYTLSQAARGPSTLTGSKLSKSDLS